MPTVINGTTGIDKIQDNVIVTADIQDGAVTPAKLSQKLVQGTAITLSGTTNDFTAIPSWAKRITLSINGLSTNGTSRPMIQGITGSGPTTSGYNQSITNIGVSSVSSDAGVASGFTLQASSIIGTASLSGQIVLVLTNSSTNQWSFSTTLGRIDTTLIIVSGGSVTLPSTLTGIRFTTVLGSESYDAGLVNILYEG